MKKYSILIVALSLSLLVQAQSNFSFSPEKPKPGDVVTFRYEAPSSVFNTSDVINCVAQKWGTYNDETGQSYTRYYKPVEIVLKKNGSYYEGRVVTDSFTRMLAFSFTSGNVRWKMTMTGTLLTDGKVDKNQNEGYTIPFYSGDGNPCRFAHFFTGKYLSEYFYNGLGIKNPVKAVEYLLKELLLFPDSKYQVFQILPYTYARQNPDKYKTMAIKEMEDLFASGLQSEKDIRLMATISRSLNLREQSSYFARLADDKLKSSSVLAARYDEYNVEQDPTKKEIILEDITRQYNKLGSEEKEFFNPAPAFLRLNFLYELATDKRYDQLTSCADKFDFLKGNTLPDGNDTYFLGLMFDQLLSGNPGYAEKLILERYNIFDGMLSRLRTGTPLPATAADEYYTAKEKVSEIAETASILADMLTQYYLQNKDSKKAWKYANKSQQYLAMTIEEPFKASDFNGRYAILSEKFLPEKESKAAIEKLVVANTWKPEMLEILKRFWVKEKKSEAGFDAYWNSLRNESVAEAKKTLLPTQLNYAAPAFTLKDMDGKEVSLQSLKGKTVVLDFWATWCGPCKASFPGMQAMVNYYKNNPDVKFLFVDTWEDRNPKLDSDEKKLQVVADFINSKKYSFHVLMDNESKVVKDFKIEAIPTKFIIDKNGNVRYKVMGAEVNEGKLFDEMSVMIESVK